MNSVSDVGLALALQLHCFAQQHAFGAEMHCFEHKVTALLTNHDQGGSHFEPAWLLLQADRTSAKKKALAAQQAFDDVTGKLEA